MSGFVVRGATVIDGTGAPGVVADVAVDGDRIVAFDALDATGAGDGPGPGAGDPVEVDGRGLVLAPGFIDTHTHDDFAVLLHPDMHFKAEGGVTTCVVGNCGMGAAPHRWGHAMGRAFHPTMHLDPWDGYAGYLARVDEAAPSVNVAALVGHGTVRAGAMGMDERAASPAELDAMQTAVAEGMAAGCLGLSSGLIYPPGRAAGLDELVALAEVVADHGGRYTSHIRDEADGLLDAVDEAIEIGRRAGVPVVISHLKATGPQNFGRVTEALARIDAAGPTVAADQYPYTAGSTVLSAVVDGNRIGGADPDRTVIASTADHPEWHGRSLRQLAAVFGVDPSEAAARVLDAEPAATVVLHVMDETDVRTVMAHPGIMIGSDGIPSIEGQPHPRLYGTFARVLGHYARDLGVLTLEEAVHRMTGRSAAVFGLTDRGVIRPGAHADLVLFDPETIVDRGTYDDPKQRPAGIRGVWVAGVRVVGDDGLHTGARPGRTLRA